MTTRDVQIAILRRLVEYDTYDEIALAALSGALNSNEWECIPEDDIDWIEFQVDFKVVLTIFCDLETSIGDEDLASDPRAVLERLLAGRVT